ncbi:hypothetical protein Tco_0020181 [Tanacetum coccineum]
MDGRVSNMAEGVKEARKNEAIDCKRSGMRGKKAQIARDEEIARQLLALDEESVTTKTKTTKDNDWNDLHVHNNYKYESFGRNGAMMRFGNFEKIWDFNHNFVPMDLEIEKEK